MVAAIILLLSTGAQAQIITTIAGNGIAGHDAWGGPATTAQLYGPAGICLNPFNGDLYIADSVNNIVRKVEAATGNIYTVAGGGTTGLGDGGPAIGAMLIGPTGVSHDGTDLYIADLGNLRIRKVNGLTGIITTIAGTGFPGLSPDGIFATTATLSGPYGVKVFRGEIFIADRDDNVIRKIDPFGKIWTVAGSVAGYTIDGGPATAAEFNLPSGVAIDGAGNIYIADKGNNVIRMINSSGMVSTFAGNHFAGNAGDGALATNANLNTPSGIAWYAGSLYIADAGNNRIRRVDAFNNMQPVAGSITGISGTLNGIGGAARFSNPAGICIDGSGTMYVADQANHTIRKISGGNVTTIAGIPASFGFSGDGGAPATAQLFNPAGVALDAAAANLYVADRDNYRVRQISLTTGAIAANSLNNGGSNYNIGDAFSVNTSGASADGVVTGIDGIAGAIVTSSLASGGTGGYFAGESFTVNAGSTLANGTIITVDAFGRVLTYILTSAGAGYSPGIAGTTPATFGSGFTINISAITNGKVTSYTLSSFGTGYATGIANTTTISGIGSGLKINITTITTLINTVAGNGAMTDGGDLGPATNAGLQNPLAIAFDGSGNMYISDQGNRIRLVNSAGTINTYSGNGTSGYNGEGIPATNAYLNAVEGIAFDLAGNLVYTDTRHSGDCVRRIVNTTNKVYTIGGNIVPGYGGMATYLDLKLPTGVTITGAGEMYIADRGNNVVRKVDTKGVMSTYAGTGVSGYTGNGGAPELATFKHPVSVAYNDASGILYIGDADNNVVRMVSGGTITTVAGTGMAGFSGDGGLAGSATLNKISGLEVNQATGDLYISDQNNNAVRMVDATGKIHTVAGTPPSGGFIADGGPATSAELTNPYSVAADWSGNIFIADRDNNIVRKINSAGIITTYAGTGIAGTYGFGDGGPATKARLSGPTGVSVDNLGNLYIADQGNNCIRKVNSAGTITTIAGSGIVGSIGIPGPALGARFYYPQSVSADRTGNLYIADGNNNRVYKMNLTAGTIAIFAGTGVAGYFGDGSSAISAQLNDPKGVSIDMAGNVFIADFLNNCVRKVDAGGTITTIAGLGPTLGGYSGGGGPAISAMLNLPASVVTDTANNSLYIADFGNQRIRRIDAGGIINSIAGNGIAGYSGDGGKSTLAQIFDPMGLAIDVPGNVYIADRNNNAVREIKNALLATFTESNTSVCQDSCVLFTNTSLSMTDNVLWTVSPTGPFISNPAIDTPTMCFNTAGIYTVSLTISYRGNNNTTTTTVNVSPTPKPVITQSVIVLSVPPVYTTYQWYKGAAKIPGAVTSSYTFSAPGTYKVVVDSAGCEGTATITITSMPNVGIITVNHADNNKYWLAQQVQDNSIVTLLSVHPVDDALSITVYDATGREILSDRWSKGSSTIQIKAASLAPGMYIIKLTNINTYEALKWLKN